jgi:putative ABC transport system permease protein
VCPADFLDWRKRNTVFEDMAAYKSTRYTLTGKGEPERIQGARVSQCFFSILFVQPILGRKFMPEEDRPGAPHVAILGHGLWRRRFGAEPSIVGKQITLDGQGFTVVGILPSDFEYPLLKGSELWTPFAFDEETQTKRGNYWLSVIARMKPGVSLQESEAQMDVIAHQLEQEYPDNKGFSEVDILPLHESVTGEVHSSLLILFGAAGFVLAIVCVNVANLLLSRIPAREKEMAIRSALGAGRWRVIRQLLTEGILLASLGGLCGGLVAFLSLNCIVRFIPTSIPRANEIGFDPRVLVFAVVISAFTGIVFSVVPAFQLARLTLHQSLKEGVTRASHGLRSKRMLSALVVVEIALTLALLTGSGLMIRSAIRVLYFDFGFLPENVLTMRLSLPEAKYPESHQITTFFQRLVERVEALPGVQYASTVSHLPLQPGAFRDFTIAEELSTNQENTATCAFRLITSNYFRTMGIPLLKGRFFTHQDIEGRELVAIINQEIAKDFWPDSDPIGKRLKLGKANSEHPWLTIVGVIGNQRDPAKTWVHNELYLPHEQYSNWTGGMSLTLRTDGDPLSFTNIVRSEVHALDRDIPLFAVYPMTRVLSRSMRDWRFIVHLFTFFAGISLILVVIGVYGVISHAVSQRTHEIGIRIALGANVFDIFKIILRQGFFLTMTGVFIGLLLALGMTRTISGLLYGVEPTDPTTFACIVIVMGVTTLAACFVPARRATRIDPMDALRYE